MRVIVVGNGIAGINTAAGLAAELSVTVDVYGGEAHPFYSRVRLPEVLSGAVGPEAITFYKPEWYEKKRVLVHQGRRVAGIDPDSKTVVLEDGRKESWDYLVLATGASANRPAIPGSDLPGIFTMRTLEDVSLIRASISADCSASSVIGGGLLGLEAARAMKDSGSKEVRVFEIFPRLLPRQLDETGAALLQKRFAAMGIEVVTSAETSVFEPSRLSGCHEIKLKDGRSFASATTLLSMGVHSNTELAKAAGLQVNRGIVVNERMETSRKGIYAVGDCAEFGGIVWGIIPAALEQAPVAAKNILASAGLLPAGIDAPSYSQTVPKTALKVGDVELMSLGKAVLSPEEAYSGKFTVFSKVSADEKRYEKYVVDAETGLLAGVILYGSKENQSLAQKLSGQPASAADLETLLAKV